ncbi:MAG: twin-arginine translocase TatA/TatE family subunit [Dehalococcoidia bacterium]|nr:twin-arginine translocase TatA/TatE family subunit [Dehalococcoidia bacterium]
MNFFGVGPAEAGVVFVIALIVIGPQRFPEIMRQAGRWYRVARAYSNEVMKDVRAAVDEIEQEVRAETDDLRSVRELTDLKADLKDARESVEAIQRDTRDAAQTDAPDAASPRTAPQAGSRADDKAQDKTKGKTEDKPQDKTEGKTETSAASKPGAARAADANGGTASVRPSVIRAVKQEPAADPPASYYEGRDPSTFDPFKAKEARDRAGQHDDAEPGNGAP